MSLLYAKIFRINYLYQMKIKNGTLRFWGDWFGSPCDNEYQITAVDYDQNQDILVIHFDNEGKCTVYHPIEIISNEHIFHISKAAKIIWEWYAYGKEHIAQNLCKIVYSSINDHRILKECSGNIREPAKYIDPHDDYALEIV